MKNSKKLLAAVLAFAAAASLVGCSQEANGSTPNTSDNTSASVQQTAGEENTENTPNPDTKAEETNATDTDAPETNPPETDPPVTEAPGNVPDSYREDGESGIKVIGKNGHYQGLMGCWGTYECCDRYVAAVNKAAAALPDVKVYNMVIPTCSDFYVPDDITGFTSSQKEKIDYIAERLKNITNVDVYSALDSHQNEYIFTRTDYHWQPLGGYYAAEAFAKTAGISDFAPLSDYTKVTKEGYVGSLGLYCPILKTDPEPFTMYISPNDGALKTTYYNTAFQNGYESDLFITRDAGAFYCSFLGSDDRIAKIETDCTNGKTLVVMKESYGNAVIPFLTQAYQTIYVCDVRYFDLNAVQFCKDVGATDLLFAVCTYTPAGGNVSAVESVIG